MTDHQAKAVTEVALKRTLEQGVRRAYRLLRSIGLDIATDFGNGGLSDIDEDYAVKVALKGWKFCWLEERGVTAEAYASWEEFVEEDCQCRATTKSGRRCRNPVMEPFVYNEITHGWQPGRDDRCAIHRVV